MTTPTENPKFSAWKFFLPILVILFLVVTALFLIKNQVHTHHNGTSREEVRSGGEIPDFTLIKFKGSEVHFSEMKEKVFLINFWATWCEACMVEMPSIVKLRNQYHEQGFEVISINVDENPESVLPKTIQEYGISFPIYQDPSGELAELFEVHAIPLSVIIDRKRKVLMIEPGERNWYGEDVKKLLERWLVQ